MELYLNNKASIESWKKKYSNDGATIKRIDNYLVHHKYAMEITMFQNTNKISLEHLRKELPKFVVPQMYYFIDDICLLDYLNKNLMTIGKKIKHKFENISRNQICQIRAVN